MITGTATYVDALQVPGMAFMAVLRSPYAHARLMRLDTQAVRHLDMPLKPEKIWRVLHACSRSTVKRGGSRT